MNGIIINDSETIQNSEIHSNPPAKVFTLMYILMHMDVLVGTKDGQKSRSGRGKNGKSRFCLKSRVLVMGSDNSDC